MFCLKKYNYYLQIHTLVYRNFVSVNRLIAKTQLDWVSLFLRFPHSREFRGKSGHHSAIIVVNSHPPKGEEKCNRKNVQVML